MEPSLGRTGESGIWHIEDVDGLVEVDGDLIAFVSTREQRHTHSERWAERGGPRCGGCRWFEISIIATRDDKYVMHRIGRSAVPGETLMFTPLTVAKTAPDLVEAAHHWKKLTETKILSSPAREALEMAAEYDDAVDEAVRAMNTQAKKVVRRI